MVDNGINSQLTPKTKKTLIIIGVAICVIMFLVMPIILFISANISLSQSEADAVNYSISIDNADNGEVTTECNIIENSRKCKRIEISGTYTTGQHSYVPISNDEDVEITLKGDNSFYLSFDAELTSSTADIPKKSIKICFGSSSSSEYCTLTSSSNTSYNLIVNINATDIDRQKVKALETEEQKKAEEAAAKQTTSTTSTNSTSSNTSSSNSSSSSSSSHTTNSSSSNSSSSSSSSKTYLLKTINAGESCPSNTKFCLIGGNSTGYPNYGWGTMRGKLINNSGKNYSYLQITAEIYNSSGSKIGDCLGNTAGLSAGATWEFEAYCDAWASGASIKNGNISGW